MADTTLVLVSHDRAFLTAATQETIQLKDKALRYFPGPYDAFVEARAAAAASAARQVGCGGGDEGQGAVNRKEGDGARGRRRGGRGGKEGVNRERQGQGNHTAQE
jgi:ATPase subunit of ABC transporter with duplicated ATPase domains